MSTIGGSAGTCPSFGRMARCQLSDAHRTVTDLRSEEQIRRVEVAEIAVIGAGYVGLTMAVGATNLGHSVSIGERDEKRVAALREGACPLFEEGVADMLTDKVRNEFDMVYEGGT